MSERRREEDGPGGPSRSRGPFAHGAGDWLAEPLEGIRGIAAALRDALEAERGTAAPFLSKILRKTEEAEDRVRRLEELAAVADGSFRCEQKTFNLRTCLKDARASTPLSARAADRIALKLPRHDCPVRGDEGKIRRAVGFLLENALAFSPAGGKIVLQLVATEEFAFVYVKDEGKGFDPRLKDRVFETYFQAPGRGRPPGAGIGTGLALAKAVFEAHGAEYGVETSAGVGSVFWFKMRRE